MLSRHNSIITLAIFVGVIALTGGNVEKEIPATKFSQNVGAPSMTFLYWYVNMTTCLLIYIYFISTHVKYMVNVRSFNGPYIEIWHCNQTEL